MNPTPVAASDALAFVHRAGIASCQLREERAAGRPRHTPAQRPQRHTLTRKRVRGHWNHVVRSRIALSFLGFCLSLPYIENSFAKEEKGPPRADESRRKGEVNLAPRKGETDLGASRFAREGVRKTGGTLARDRSGLLTGPKQSRALSKGTEDRIVPSRIPGPRRSALKKPPKNAYTLAFDRLREHAAQVAPSAAGRLRISFLIDKKGKPQQISVRGLGSKIDAGLAELLRQQVFPKKDAGQFYASRLTIKAQKPVKNRSIGKSKKRTKRKRRASARAAAKARKK